MSMLSLGFRSGEYAFIFSRGQPIGAIVARSDVVLAFAGTRDDLEVMRSKVLERRLGREELQRLIELFNLEPSVSRDDGP